MSLLLAVAVATPLVAVAWVLLTPLVVRGRAEGSLEDGLLQLEAEARFAPLVARVHGWPPAVALTIAGIHVPLPRQQRARTTRPHSPAADRVAEAGNTLRFLLQHRGLLTVRSVEGQAIYGSDDPALTGEVHGLLCTARPLLDPHGRVALLPDWSMRDVLAGRLELELRVAAGRLALAYGWAAFSRSARRRRARGHRPEPPGRSDTSRTATAPVA